MTVEVKVLFTEDSTEDINEVTAVSFFSLWCCDPMNEKLILGV